MSSRRLGFSVSFLAVALTLFGVIVGISAGTGQLASSLLDEAISAFWIATSPDEIEAAASRILASGADIETVWSGLRAGRTYRSNVPIGRQILTRDNADRTAHDYAVLVPESYNPATRYPVRVYLHGGVARPKRENGQYWRNEDRIARDDAIIVTPGGWVESLWWQDSQIENLVGIINDLKRTYNVDENRVFLLGVSDGATGAFYQAFKATTPWAAFLMFNGHPVVLANPASGVDGDMHVTNLRNKPLFVINGGRDRLYPTSSVLPYMRLFQNAGVSINFRPQPNAGHDMSWWDDESAAMDEFMEPISRRSMPARLSWETERTDRYNRAHWLIISELGSVEGEPELDSHNTIIDPSQGMAIGINMLGELQDGSGLRIFEVGDDSIASAAGMMNNDTIVEVDGHLSPSVEDLKESLIGFAPGQQIPLVVQRDGERVTLSLVYPAEAAPRLREAFPTKHLSGRVEVDQRQNHINVYTRGVRRFKLLLSPEQFDFTAPITVVTNGVTVFEGTVDPDVATLLRWAAIDQDRTAMFGAELDIDVQAEP